MTISKLYVIASILLIVSGFAFFIGVMEYEKQQGYLPDPILNAPSSPTTLSQDDNFTYTFPNGTTIINKNSTTAKLWAPWRFITGE